MAIATALVAAPFVALWVIDSSLLSALSHQPEIAMSSLPP